MESGRTGLEGMEDKRVVCAEARRWQKHTQARQDGSLCNDGIIIVLQIYDDGLSVPSCHGCVHRHAVTASMNHCSVCLVNVSENVHLALL